MTFGFIITRHVNSEQTNKYWNHNIKLLRTHYPLKKIVIIDDNSNYSFVKADFDYKNVETIQSEYPGRGELLPYLLRIASYLRNNSFIKQRLTGSEMNILGMSSKDKFNLCFGGQTFISHRFLSALERKYNINNLVNAVTCRTDRCGLERILGLLFNNEYKDLNKIKSINGDIRSHYSSFVYNFDNYLADLNNNIVRGTFVKVWTGR